MTPPASPYLTAPPRDRTTAALDLAANAIRELVGSLDNAGERARAVIHARMALADIATLRGAGGAER
ncbi:MAG TPA: hypothetical protein VHY35_17830 [Stellaceae bacterium]|jgi:hypothetical protein|nr:hypothetical protein [Stellaceae bacterium]